MGSIAIYFITQLPLAPNVFYSVTTYVDVFTKSVHFVASKGSDTALNFSNAFFSEIFLLHGHPDSLFSDLNAMFTARFQNQLTNLCGIKLRMYSIHYPHSEGDCNK